MNTIKANIGNWNVECLPDDGARISVLQYAGKDLLSVKPFEFNLPDKFYGEFETRPVYGYDDCFPTVDPCQYPGSKLLCRDHGELCWQKWQVQFKGNSLICVTESHVPTMKFSRTLEFSENNLKWKFEVSNLSRNILPFLHVMHPLMPLKEIQRLRFPKYTHIVNENKSKFRKVN